MSFNLKEIRNVLVLMPDKHMGNLVVSLPTIRTLKEFFYERNFYLVVDSSYREIVETINGLNNLLFYPRNKLDRSPFTKRLGIYYEFLKELRSTFPDIAIDLEGRHSSSIMTILSGASLRVGSSTGEWPYFYNLKVDISAGKHRVYSYIEIAVAIGVQTEHRFFRLMPSDNKRVSLRNKLLSNEITTEKPIVCLHPGAGKIYKQWTSGGFAEISDWLSSRGNQVVFVGGKGDLDRVNEVRSRLKQPSYSLAAKLSLGELMALFETSSLYIGNDTGPMHIAATMDTPVIALFGPADEKRWGPLTEKSIVLRGEDPCQKCKGRDCQYDFKCIKTLSPDDVKAAVERLINGK